MTDLVPLEASPTGRTPLLERMLRSYADEVSHTKLAPKTRTAYTRCVRQFLAWLGDNAEVYRPEDVFTNPIRRDHAARDYRRYLLKDKKAAGKSVDLHGSALGNLFATVGVGKPDWPVSSPRGGAGKPKSLEEKQRREVLRQAELRGARDYAIVGVFINTGVRLAELGGLDLGDVAITERTGAIRVVGKGDKPREVPLNSQARTILRPWYDQRRREAAGDRSAPLFTSTEGHRMHLDTIRHAVKRVGAASGVGGLHPHMFRHTCAVTLVEGGTDVALVQQVLGHASLDTTRIYLQRSQDRVAEALESAITVT